MGTLMTQFVTPEPATMPLSSTSNTGKRPHFASGFIIRVSQRTRWKRNIAGAGDHRCVVANSVFKSYPPKTRNCFPVQIPASGGIRKRGAGALSNVSGVHRSALGSYRAPLLRHSPFDVPPPHTIISLPVQTAMCEERSTSAPWVEIGVQRPVTGLKRAPSLKERSDIVVPPQTIISVPVQITVCL